MFTTIFKPSEDTAKQGFSLRFYFLLNFKTGVQIGLPVRGGDQTPLPKLNDLLRVCPYYIKY